MGEAALHPQEEALAQPSSLQMEATISLVVPKEQWEGILVRSCSVMENRAVPQFPHSPTKPILVFSFKQGGSCYLEPNIMVTGQSPSRNSASPKHNDAAVLGDTG